MYQKETRKVMKEVDEVVSEKLVCDICHKPINKGDMYFHTYSRQNWGDQSDFDTELDNDICVKCAKGNSIIMDIAEMTKDADHEVPRFFKLVSKKYN